MKIDLNLFLPQTNRTLAQVGLLLLLIAVSCSLVVTMWNSGMRYGTSEIVFGWLV